MTTFIVRRLFGAIPLVLGIATIIFFVVNLAPGDPANRFLNPNMSPEARETGPCQLGPRSAGSHSLRALDRGARSRGSGVLVFS